MTLALPYVDIQPCNNRIIRRLGHLPPMMTKSYSLLVKSAGEDIVAPDAVYPERDRSSSAFATNHQSTREVDMWVSQVVERKSNSNSLGEQPGPLYENKREKRNSHKPLELCTSRLRLHV